jgi:hypothetical protein
MFTASDLADWFDEWQDKQYRLQDEWLIQSQNLGDAHPFFVFCSWYGNRVNTAPQRLLDWLVGGVVDVLRLGCDIELDSAWGIAKGAFLSLSRIAVVAGPVGEMLGVGARYAGLVGTATLDGLSGISAPCRFVSVNNALSAVRGKRVQLFSSLDDLIKSVRSGAPGANMVDEILKHPRVAPLIEKAGVTWKELGDLKSFEAAMEKAREVKGAVVVGLQWVDKFGKTHAHRVTLVKSALGDVRILDYSSGAEFRGFSSLREMAVARGGVWEGFDKAVIRPGVLLFESDYVKFLELTEGVFHLGLPVAMGLSWGKGKSLDSSAAEIAESVWKFLKSKLGLNAPAPPPEIAQPTPAPTPPPQSTTPPPEAANAPRSDWLTGVQYRLHYLAYYNGPIHGVNDRATKDAVIQFQTDQRIQIDAIPGPQTQAELVTVCGF